MTLLVECDANDRSPLVVVVIPLFGVDIGHDPLDADLRVAELGAGDDVVDHLEENIFEREGLIEQLGSELREGALLASLLDYVEDVALGRDVHLDMALVMTEQAMTTAVDVTP
ncbi:hypothetical protein B7Y92_03570 [Candidatus Saccharibacteria bacterium 32-50-13]|nr:MAG: hypothetical protein B7Y92_03570 [Candidatus Saccharibacteria bacterium 32-50-13]